MFSPQKGNGIYEVMEVLINATVAITSQYINVTNHHAVHLKLTQCHMLIISQ